MIYKLYEKRPEKRWFAVANHADLHEMRNMAVVRSFVNIANQYAIVNYNYVSGKVRIIEYWEKGQLKKQTNVGQAFQPVDSGNCQAGKPDLHNGGDKCSNGAESSDINLQCWLWASWWPMRALWRSLRAGLQKVGLTGDK